MRASYAHHRSPGYFVWVPLSLPPAWFGVVSVDTCLVSVSCRAVLSYCSQTAWPSSARLFLPPLAIPAFDTLALCFVLLVRRTVYSIYSVFVSFSCFCEHRVQYLSRRILQHTGWVALLYSVFSSSFFYSSGHAFALLSTLRLKFAFAQITLAILINSFLLDI